MTEPSPPPLDRTHAAPNTIGGPPPAHLLQAAAPQQRTFGRFVIVKELGRGGMGVVIQAWDPRLARHVAIKVVDPNLAGGNALARFQREAQAMGRLNHPGIVPVLEVGEEQGRPYLVMEMVAGESMEALLRREQLPLRRGVELVRDVAQALAEAHRLGVLHRDIKPANVLIDETGRPRLTDFGLARVGVASLTKTGDMLGTPTYMPPEQTGESAAAHGPPSDVYSLGVLLYRTVTGRPPIESATVAEYMTKLAMVVPKPMRTLVPTVDPMLDAIAACCLEKAPGKRYPHAGALADALTVWLAGPPPLIRRGSPLVPVATFVGGALLAGAAVALALRSGEEPATVVTTTPPPSTATTEPAPSIPPAPSLPPRWAGIQGARAKLSGVFGDPGHRHAHGVKAIAVSPDGATIVSADGPYAGNGPAFLHRWEQRPDGLHEQNAWRAGSGWITAIAFTVDGKRVLAGARDGMVACWDLNGERVGKPMAGTEVQAVQVIDATQAFVARVDELSIIDLSTWTVVTSRPLPRLTAAALLPGTPRRALVTLEGEQAQAVIVPLEGGDARPLGLAGPRAFTIKLSEDGKWAVSAGDGNSVREWDLVRETAGPVRDGVGSSVDYLRGEGRAWVSAMTDGRVFRRTSLDFVAELIDLRVGPLPFYLTSLGNGRVLIGSESRRLALIELDGRELRRPETPGSIWPGTMAVLPGRRVAVGHDGTLDRAGVRVLSLDDGRTLATARTGGARPVAVLAQGDDVVVVDHHTRHVTSVRESVVVYGLSEAGLKPRWRKQVENRRSDEKYLSCATLSTGERLTFLVGDHDGQVRIWSTTQDGEGAEVAEPQFFKSEVEGEDVLAAVSLDEKSAVFALAVEKPEHLPWESWTGRLVFRGSESASEVELPAGGCALAKVTPRRVLAGCMNGQVLQWDPRDSGQTRVLEGWKHEGRVWALATSPSARTAVSCGLDDRVIVWALDKRELVDTLDLTSSGDMARAVAFVDETTFVVGTARGVVLKFELAP